MQRTYAYLSTELSKENFDLQAATDRNYDGGAYIRRIDYRKHPSIPIRLPDEEWADALLRSRGLHPQPDSLQQNSIPQEPTPQEQNQ